MSGTAVPFPSFVALSEAVEVVSSLAAVVGGVVGVVLLCTFSVPLLDAAVGAFFVTVVSCGVDDVPASLLLPVGSTCSVVVDCSVVTVVVDWVSSSEVFWGVADEALAVDVTSGAVLVV